MTEILQSIKELNIALDLLEENFQKVEELSFKLNGQEKKRDFLKSEIENIRSEVSMLVNNINEKK